MRHTVIKPFQKWAILGILVAVILGSPPQIHAAKAGQSWAVVIGIEDYKHEPQLKFAEDDAREMASVLGQLGFQVLPPLYNEAATHDAILELIQGQLSTKVSPQDRVVVYFSGHGVTWGQKGQQQLGYLMPVEGNRKSPYLKGISMQEIRGIANALPARQVLFLIDACYGGMAGGVEKGGTLPVMDDMYVQQLQREKGRWLMTAGGADQEALELGERQHGAFTYFLLEGLGTQRVADKDNNRYITIGELFHFVKPRVFEQAQYLGKRQMPELWNLSMGDKGEMVFVYPQSSPIVNAIAPILTPSASPPPVVASLPTYQAPKTLTKAIRGQDDAPMVLVPAGRFTMGSNDGDDDEKPQREVELDAFYIDTYEVTTSRYAKFFQSTGREKPKYWTNTVLVSQGDRPVVGVTWDDANAYCEKYGKRLPTEAEWEKAARGTDGRKYPWGNSDPDSNHANFDRYVSSWETDLYSTRLKPVGNYEVGKSPYGVYDMAGNVWERTESWYDKDQDTKVIRGGSWYDGAGSLRAANRLLNWPTGRYYDIGFRCAQDAR